MRQKSLVTAVTQTVIRIGLFFLLMALNRLECYFYQLILAPLRQLCHFRKAVTSLRIGGSCVFSQPIFYLQPLFIYFSSSLTVTPPLPPSQAPTPSPARSLPPPPSEKRRSLVTCVMRLMHEGTEHITERAPHESYTHTHNRAAEQKPRSSRPEGR